MKTHDRFACRRSLMIQGTTSDAGKSTLVTAICRILHRKGYRVAPFKPQNMALNSAVAIEGGEIGRAQAVQAMACGISPSVMMNPILLKPTSEQGAQVIVNGQAVSNMQAAEFQTHKGRLLNTVLQAHAALSNQYDHVIVEGAGSPAEVNLRHNDLANMGFAEAVDCPVIIVADIERGGVFAHLYGTWAVLSESEKSRIVGFVINRFRGDASLLDSGLQWLLEKTGVPVLAVLRYLENLHLEAEDSISQNQTAQSGTAASVVRVAVPMYPRASNHTDFDVLRMHPDVDCRFFRDPVKYPGADLIVLPGSKHVRGDLHWLREAGWEEVIRRHLRYGGKLIGLCGGYQMLGQWVHDTVGVESSPGSTAGLGLLDLETTLREQKTLRNVCGVIRDTDLKVRGYEIHAGTTTGGGNPVFVLQDEGGVQFTDGALNDDENVMGTYLHGLFDTEEMLSYWLNWLGPRQLTPFDYLAHCDAEIERLADAVESQLPSSMLMQIMGGENRP